MLNFVKYLSFAGLFVGFISDIIMKNNEKKELERELKSYIDKKLDKQNESK